MESDSSTSTIYAKLADNQLKKIGLRNNLQPQNSPNALPDSGSSYFSASHSECDKRDFITRRTLGTIPNIVNRSISAEQANPRPQSHNSSEFKKSICHTRSSATIKATRGTTSETEGLEPSPPLSSTTNMNPKKLTDIDKDLLQTKVHLLGHESDSLPTTNTFEASQKSSALNIFELRFEDRQRIASLISELANAQEQVELLESRMQSEQEGFRQRNENQLNKIQLLSNRCKFLVLQNAARMEATGTLGKLHQDYKQDTEEGLNAVIEENKDQKARILSLEQSNSCLQTRMANIEKKYGRCLEDNQRLKWILRTIQQREEILLTHNKCFSSQQYDTECKQYQGEPKPIGRINISKTDNPKSIPSSPLTVSDATQTVDANLGLDLCSASATSSPSILDQKNDLAVWAYHRRSGGDFHELHVYEPHIVIPSMDSPVIMKIPKSPIMSGWSSHTNGKKSKDSEQNITLSQSRLEPLPEQQTTNKFKTVCFQSAHNPTQSTEEDILSELFFTF